jgi:hypothetical protein
MSFNHPKILLEISPYWKSARKINYNNIREYIGLIFRVNEKRLVKPLLKKKHNQSFIFEIAVADAQYDSSKVRNTVANCGAEPVIP